MTWDVRQGDCLAALREMPDASVDAVVTDPPYGLGKPPPIAELMRAWCDDADHDHLAGSGGFMGRKWDAMVPHPRIWTECLRVLKPGGHLVVFAGQRTADLMGVALRFGGAEIRDQLQWLTYSGFPKALDVSKAIDAAAGAEREVVGRYQPPNGKPWNLRNDTSTPGNGGTMGKFGARSGGMDITAPATPEAAQWEGWHTALKPCAEPAWLARKPLGGTVAATVLEHGTGALNIDATRYAYGDPAWPGPQERHADIGRGKSTLLRLGPIQAAQMADGGRWPANVYYCPKASRSEREAGLAEAGIEPVAGFDAVDRAEGSAGLTPRAGAGRTAKEIRNTHNTVKPIGLMSWLVRLVTPPGGLVVDPFCGSGTTGIAAATQGFRFIGCEMNERYVNIARARIDWHTKGFRDEAMRGGSDGVSDLPLFGVS